MSQPLAPDSHSVSPREAWESFVASRFDLEGGVSALTTRLSSLDLELALLQEQTVVAKRRRNSVTACGRLPSELWVVIYSFLQTTWPTSRVDETRDGGIQRYYSYGWMTVTQVCHSWRTAALSAHKLWTQIDCLSLPPASITTVLSRSKAMPLSLILSGPDAPPGVFGDWLYASVLRRTRTLAVTDMSKSDFPTIIECLNGTLPALEELTLMLPTPTRLPADVDARLMGVVLPQLSHLTLQGFVLNWSWPMFASNLTHLSLLSCPREVMINNPSLEPQLLPVISTMSKLQYLHLHDVLPEVANASSTPHELPKSLVVLATISTTINLAAGHTPLVERSHCAVCDVQVLSDDKAILTPLIRTLFQTVDSDSRPAMELSIFNRHIIVAYETSRPRALWSIKLDAPVGVMRSFRGIRRRHLHVLEPRSLFGNTGRAWKLDQYLPLLPMQTLEAITLSQTTISNHFAKSQAWVEAFSAASNVRRLVIPYRRVHSLFFALATVRTPSTAPTDDKTFADDKFVLFPRLETLVLHEGVVSRKDDIALMDFLNIREANGAPLQELMVEESLLSLTDIWESAKEATSVPYFKACSADEALGAGA